MQVILTICYSIFSPASPNGLFIVYPVAAVLSAVIVIVSGIVAITILLLLLRKRRNSQNKGR